MPPVNQPHFDDESESQRVISPFARTTSTVQTSSASGGANWALWVLGGILVLALVGTVGFFAYRYLSDPYRTLEQFPMDKYLADYRSLEGAKFKADLKVSADLGFKPDTGRLMVFNVENDTSSRPLVVLIPQNLSGIYFTKGQNYQVALEVGDGGLVYADSCEKE